MTNKFDIAFDLITEFEGWSGTSYTCPAGIPTIGYGRTTGSMRPTTKAAEKDCLYSKLREYDQLINKVVAVPLTANQMASLFSFIYNVGEFAFLNSMLLQLLKAGKVDEAGEQLLRWDKSVISGQKRVLPGLTRRRQAEFALWQTSCQSH
jgi:lysozyme